MTKQLKVSFHTFGCKLNQVETESIAGQFAAEGYEICSDSQADLFIVNTCAVTSRAEAKSRRYIRKLARLSPGKVIAVGCYPQLKYKEAAGIDGVKIAAGVKDKFKILSLLNNGDNKVSEDPSLERFPAAEDLNFHSRAFVKIQDGCDHGCGYCVVPLLRGLSVSLNSSIVIERIKRLLSVQREIVLTGVDIGSYKDETGCNLADLLNELVKLPDLVRIRLSSIEPPGFSDELLDICASDEKICPHFHLPLQSGSDRILSMMGRGYSASDYIELVKKISAWMPDARIGADVIVGFSHECGEDFNRTKELIDSLPITHIHVFPFSPRPGTKFSVEEDNVPFEIKSDRAEELKKIVHRKREAYIRRFIGKEMMVFFEGASRDCGFTENYIKVKVPNFGKSGFFKVRIQNISGDMVYGVAI